MALLKSVDNVPGIHYYEYRMYEYWSRFKYRARLEIPGSRYFHYVSSVDAWEKRIMSKREVWTTKSADDKQGSLDDFNAYIARYKPVLEKLLEFKKTVKHNKNEFIVRAEGDTVAIFSNDLQKLHELKNWGKFDVDFTEAVMEQPGYFAGTKYFVRQPKHKYRVHLKTKRVDVSVMIDLTDLFKRSKTLCPSVSLKRWLESADNTRAYRGRYCSSAYTIEYDDESAITYLGLMHGDLLGRRYNLEKRPDTNEK